MYLFNIIINTIVVDVNDSMQQNYIFASSSYTVGLYHFIRHSSFFKNSTTGKKIIESGVFMDMSLS